MLATDVFMRRFVLQVFLMGLPIANLQVAGTGEWLTDSGENVKFAGIIQ